MSSLIEQSPERSGAELVIDVVHEDLEDVTRTVVKERSGGLSS